jgi:hypothetical protein
MNDSYDLTTSAHADSILYVYYTICASIDA